MRTHRADVIGSLLRPAYLLRAREAHAAGAITDAEYKRLEDRAVDDAVGLQERTGVDVVTDVEQRRTVFASQLVQASDGFAVVPGNRVDWFTLDGRVERSGDFAPLRDVPDDKVVVLGLITTKWPRVETATEPRGRIQDAAAYVPLDRLALSPQCGFASVAAGNAISAGVQERKLRLVADVAHAVWQN